MNEENEKFFKRFAAKMSDEPTRLPEWTALVEDALSWEYEEVVPHEYIERIVGVKRRAGALYYSRVNRAIKELMYQHRHVVSVSGKGYMLIHPRDVIGGHANRLIEKVDAAAKRTVEVLVAVDGSKLTPDECHIWRYKLDRTMVARAATERAKVDLIARAREAPKIALSKSREN